MERGKNEECIKGINGLYNVKSFILTITDNGMGFPENIDIEDLNSLGLKLVTSLVEQLDGELELKRDNGTTFIIRFTIKERSNEEPLLRLKLVNNKFKLHY